MDKKTVIEMLQADLAYFHEEYQAIIKAAQYMQKDNLNYVQALRVQIRTTGTTSLLKNKTPKVSKKGTTKIKAIPENDELEASDDNGSPRSSASTRSSRMNPVALETSEMPTGRAKRGASIKAADIIKKQQSSTLNLKLRRPSNNIPEKTADSCFKRPTDSLGSTEDDDVKPTKQIKMETKKSQNKINNDTQHSIEETIEPHNVNETYTQEKPMRASSKRKLENQIVGVNDASKPFTRQNSLFNDEPAAKKANYSKPSPKENGISSKSAPKQKSLEKKVSTENKNSIASNTSSSSLINPQSSKKANNIINETMDISNPDETVVSMYEDAIGKAAPIMSSTINPNSTRTLESMMNVTVVIENLQGKKVLDETLTIATNLKNCEPLSRLSRSTLKEKIIDEEMDVDKAPATHIKSKELNNPISLKSQKLAKINQYNDLLTDDESSPERKEYKAAKEKIADQPKRITRSNNSLMSDDDEILRTPPVKVTKQSKNLKGYKQPVLFSPYAKDSVKKRVEAFEQVAVSPKQPETAGRVTRTKTRALAAATETPSLGQKLARKSLAKAKKISLAKHAKEYDDMKENENCNIVKSTKSGSLERSSQKPSSKTTPLSKTRVLQMPNSVSKNNYATPNSQYINSYSKPLTAPRGNIVTNVDSFIQPMKSGSKQIDRAAEDKRRRVHEEDARRKREELLKAQADEKRRKREEKELKNKLAREAKEKLDYEKRLKAEREREEKARLAQQMQEKQKEEVERKRMAALQRAHEKEERRKQDEFLRLQRLQEQEEQEKQLAEQKRREQEMEKRKQAEMRQQMAEVKMKNQMDKALLQQAKAKAFAKKQAPCNYKIDSDPDEDESDDENKPKHKIPNWASKQARQPQVTMQQYIPMNSILRFFDAKKCTPDLRELFRGIDPKKLKRSSSAIWKTPPRYSMMNRSIIRN